MTPTAQITLSWNGSELFVETGGPNGSRRKLNLSFAELPFELREELDGQLTRKRDALRATARAQQASNIQYVSERHAGGIAFARQIWGTPAVADIEFSRALRRLHNTSAESAKPTAGAKRPKLSTTLPPGKTLKGLGL